MNKFVGCGNLAKDGEFKITQNNHNVYNNTIAIRNDYKNSDGEYGTTFLNFNCWGYQADYMNKYASKGAKVLIEGKINNRSYDDKDGNKRYVTEIITERIQVLSSTNQNKNDATQNVIQDIPQNIKTEYDDLESGVTLSDDDFPF